MRAMPDFNLRSRCGGVTLLEVLIALVVLSIGLLGLAGLQTASLRFNTSSYYRTQATVLAYELADRMRANRAAAMATGTYYDPFDSPPPACDLAAAAMEVTTPATDIAAWRASVACRLPQGTASVGRDVNNELTIIVQWDDSRGREAPEEFQLTTGL